MSLEGSLRALLVAERTLLNFMTHLSGVASATYAWSRALEGTDCRVRDTRKTTPGLRQLEKYAVRCGGGMNHRMGLGDAALIKDNHVAATGSITAAIDDVRRRYPDVPLEVECDTLEQVEEALSAGCSLILLDNMSVRQIEEAVELARPFLDVRLEASGGLTLSSAAEVAATGVDYVAVGALTHSVRALDLGLDLL
jgi:nicotinate-nucleotide pyrophosphorylase (carboxylating)